MSGPPVLVQKFGGTSVSTADRRGRVVEHVRRARASGLRVAIVVSAMGRRGDPYATDTLLDLLRADGGGVAPDDYDLMFTCGEAISVAVVSQALKRGGIAATGLTAAQAGIYSNGVHLEADVTRIDTGRLHALLEAGTVPVVAGGQAVAPGTLDFTTLGRGGSDTSGVALGVALGACRVEIFTDVEGVHAADPRLVPGAPMRARIGYAAMYELARFGAKVLHPRAIAAGMAGGTPVVVRSTFSEAPGTLVADVIDEAPLVGLAALPPMETFALPAGSVPDAVRDGWERTRLVMSIVDRDRREIIVGAADDKAGDLRAAVDEAAVGPSRRLGRCCWLSVVGDGLALAAADLGWVRSLRTRAIDVYAREIGVRRATYVVPEAGRQAAAEVVYETMASRV